MRHFKTIDLFLTISAERMARGVKQCILRKDDPFPDALLFLYTPEKQWEIVKNLTKSW